MSRGYRSVVLPGLLVLIVAVLPAACQSRGQGSAGGNPSETREAALTSASSASQILAAVQAQPGSPVQPAVAQGFNTVAGGLSPQFSAAAVASEPKPATVLVPQLCTAPLHLADVASGAAVDISLKGALPVAAQSVGGYVVYPSAFGAGGTVLHRALPSGSEDFINLPTRPTTPEVDYSVSLGTGVAGLRLVSGTLEMLDATGTPRLHVSPPYIVGADGGRTDGALAVTGCAVDSDPSAPWGRAVTAPGAATCTVRVTWPDASVTYPAILDPRWTTTGSMGTARFEHTLLLLSTGKALAAGGRSSTSGTTGLATAELYDPTSGTWSPTGSMAHARRLQSMTQLGSSSNSTTSGKVLVAGGISGTTSTNSAELYSPSAGTWIAAGNLDVARHAHTATLLADGRVLAAGGLNGTTMLTTAALYNPTSGAGTWVATTGPVPPTGIKNHTATLIQTTNTQLNNHVLLVGGNNGTSTVSAVYLFDPVQNAFSTLASIPSPPREQHTAVTLVNSNGKILVAGGKNGSTVLASAIVFDPGFSNGTWSSAGTMTSPRVGHTMTLLPSSIVANGQLLVAGGSSTGSDTLSSAELFSGTSTWTATPAMPGPLQGQRAVLLSGNMVLVAGGLSSTSTVQNAAYLYDASFGLSCTTNSQCSSGFCSNGICCNNACNTGTCGACNLAGHLGTCTALTSGTVCRAAAAGGCDVAETCNGTALTCPSDAFAPSTTVCRAAAGECDAAETCTGSSAGCPADGKKTSGTPCTDDGNPCTQDKCDGTAVTCQHPVGNAGTVCRAQNGECDVAETCTGTSATCPTDGRRPSGTACSDDGNVCTLDRCDGSSAACQHPAGNAGVVCRAQNGECDVAETCTGTSASCPADGRRPSGNACTDDGNVCTLDQCDGTSAACQHPAGHAGVVCRAQNGACDVAETCTGTSATCPTNGFQPPTTVCRAQNGACDVAENCTGTSGSCPADGKAPNGTHCDDGNACTQTDTCQSGTCSGANPALFGVPQSDPTAAKCPDGTSPVGCQGFDCTTGLATGWLATPVCSQSVSCTASCPASGCVPQNQRAGTVVQCDCSCADPTGGTPLTLSVQACGSSTTSCADLCAQTYRSCSTGNCFVGACSPVAGTSPETVLAGSCRSSDSGVVTVIAPYTGTIDPTSSTVVADLGGKATTGAVSGTVGFSTDIVPGIFTLTSLQAQLTGPVQFFGRQIDALQVNLRRPLFGAEVAGESGFTQVTLAVQPDDLAAQVVVGGVPQFLSLDGVTSLSGTLSSDRSVLSLSASQTQSSGDSISMNLTAVTSNSPPQPTITVAPGTTLECTGNRAASATFSATVVDPDLGDSIKRIQWFLRDERIGDGDTQLVPLGAGSAVTASLLLGQQQISAVAYDQHEAAGQSAVIVQVRDTIAPVVTAPPDQSFYAGVGGASVEVNLGNATIQEACDPRPVVSVVTSLDPDSPLRGATIPNPGDVVLPVGQIPIIWTVTDVSGNTASATQTVTVVAQDPPTGTPPPAPITIPAPQTCPAGTGAMTVSPPGSGQVSIDLNVCIVGRINSGVKEGAAPWEQCQGQDDPCTDTAIQALLATANSIFSGFVNFNYKGFKRIADPYPPAPDGTGANNPFPCQDNSNIEVYGDACIDEGLFGDDTGTEPNKMLSDCYAMWGYPPPNVAGETDTCQRPVTLLLVRDSLENSHDPDVCGLGTPALTSATTPLVCMDPQNLANNTSGAFAIVATEGNGLGVGNNCGMNVPLTIAHELGHTLGLGHGDGLDDDCNGVWDSFCDPNELETGPTTLMDANGDIITNVVTPLQTDRARIFATKSVQMGFNYSTNVCPSTSVPAGPVDSKAPFVGCGCRTGGSPGSMWGVGLIGLAIVLRRRPRRRW